MLRETAAEEGVRVVSNGRKLGLVATLIGMVLLVLGMLALFSGDESGGVPLLLGGLVALVGSVLWVANRS